MLKYVDTHLYQIKYKIKLSPLAAPNALTILLFVFEILLFEHILQALQKSSYLFSNGRNDSFLLISLAGISRRRRRRSQIRACIAQSTPP